MKWPDAGLNGPACPPKGRRPAPPSHGAAGSCAVCYPPRRRQGRRQRSPRAHPTYVERRLRGGKSLVAYAHEEFADPSASIARSIYPVVAPVIPDALSLSTDSEEQPEHRRLQHRNRLPVRIFADGRCPAWSVG